MQTIKAQQRGLINVNDDFVEEVKFSVDEKMIYLLDITVNGMLIKGKFLFDNGCRESFITESLASQLQLRNYRYKNVLDIYGGKKKLPYSRLNYVISGVEFPKVKTTVLSDASLGCNVHGIIGRNLLQKCIWSISLKKGISMSNKSSHYNLQDFYKQELLLGTGVKTNFLHGDSTVSCFFDLGAQTLITINNDSTNNVGVIKENEISCFNTRWETIFGSYRVEQDSIITTTDQLLIGGVNLLNDPIGIKYPIVDVDRDIGEMPIVGCVILDYYDVILDTKGEEIYFKNIKSSYEQYFTLGFSVEIKEQSVYIAYLVNDSPAYKAGLQVSDQIEEINGKRITEILTKTLKCDYDKKILSELVKELVTTIKVSRLAEPLYIKKDYPFTLDNKIECNRYE
ncbi:retropepsin-like aspartic protease [Saccharicrinis aurantiacus]|uniref:retropepsin-like aspartic protease n=1 Tax=Saccharicrinis aurantiacus TaxID=1849719 RepID=UPI0024922080|nr:aspartyl protease family protein [Saccharicrinis aurantiacus]